MAAVFASPPTQIRELEESTDHPVDPEKMLEQILLNSKDAQDLLSIVLIKELQKGKQDLALLRVQKESAKKIESFVLNTFARVRSECLVNPFDLRLRNRAPLIGPLLQGGRVWDLPTYKDVRTVLHGISPFDNQEMEENPPKHPLAASLMRFMALIEKRAGVASETALVAHEPEFVRGMSPEMRAEQYTIIAQTILTKELLVSTREKCKQERERMLVQVAKKREHDRASLAVVVQRSTAHHAQMMQELESTQEICAAGVAQAREERDANQRLSSAQIAALKGNIESMEAAHVASATALQEQIAAASIDREAAIVIIQQTAEATKQQQAAALATALRSVQEAQAANQAQAATFQATAGVLHSTLADQKKTADLLLTHSTQQQKELQEQTKAINNLRTEAEELRIQAYRPPTIIYEDSGGCLLM